MVGILIHVFEAIRIKIYQVQLKNSCKNNVVFNQIVYRPQTKLREKEYFSSIIKDMRVAYKKEIRI